MKNKNEQGFALVLSLVLMLAMSLMGGALIVISAGDHKSNNNSDEYQQTFYVAETALLEGEKYVLEHIFHLLTTQFQLHKMFVGTHHCYCCFYDHQQKLQLMHHPLMTLPTSILMIRLKQNLVRFYFSL